MHIHHINLRRVVAEREVHTHALTRALLQAQAGVTLYGHPDNPLWDSLPAKRVDAPQAAALESRLPATRSLLFVQTPLPEEAARRLAARHILVGFPGEGAKEWLRHCALVVGASRHGVQRLRQTGTARVYPAPLYGVGEAQRGDATAKIVKTPPYHWDRGKPRDVVLAGLAPLAALFGRLETYEKRAGLTLGIVSALAPAEQYPALLSLLAPLLARHEVNLEIFGAGDFGEVRAIREALAPLGERARFWGYQKELAAVYPRIDYLLAGLPEGHALGLDVLEAQACGTPVVAPRLDPFGEIVIHGHTGYLYADPRGDRGTDFGRLIATLKSAPRPDPRRAVLHLSQFSQHALFERTRRLLDHLVRTRIAT